MNTRLLTMAVIPLTSMLLRAQDTQSWTGLLVASGCQAGAASSLSGADATAHDGMARKTPKAPREQNATYEQAQNQSGSQPPASSSATSGKMARTTDRGTEVSSTADPLDRTTTPPIDDKGTRGKATMNNTASKDAANRTGSTGANSPDVARLDGSCRIGEHTTSFALQLNDGKLVLFDEASNSKIAQQLQSSDRLQHKTKIFRTTVKGVLRNSTISVDSIQI